MFIIPKGIGRAARAAPFFSLGEERNMKETWKTHERHMKETWKKHERNMKETWKKHERNMKETWKKHERNMKETWKKHERNMKEHEWTWMKMNENEWKWMKKEWKKNEKRMKKKENERKWNKMKENRVPFPECSLFPRELGEPPGRLPFFPGRGANFLRMCIIPQEKSGAAQGTPSSDPRATRERPVRDLWGQVFWRREISIYRTEMKRLDWGASAVSSRALIWRFSFDGRTWPTRRPPKTTLNLIITRMCTIPQAKVTTSQYKSNKASSECALFPKESWSAATDFEYPRKEKRETKKGRNFLRRKAKGK